MSDDWLFTDPPNLATFTTQFVLDGSPILRVYRDYDGAWQFHGFPDHPASTDVARIVSLASMVLRDSSLVGLRELPWGWRAIRNSVDSPWAWEKNNPFPTHHENRYYLEDAIWTSQYRDDVKPPPEIVRNDLTIGSYAKLLFRFAAENAERRDGEVERMWVRVTYRDQDENYEGTLESEPVHNGVLRLGAKIHFHPLHVMDVLGSAPEKITEFGTMTNFPRAEFALVFQRKTLM